MDTLSIAIVTLKKNINCAFETLGRNYESSFQGHQLTLHLPQFSNDYEPQSGQRLIAPSILNDKQLLNSYEWGSITGPVFEPGTKPFKFKREKNHKSLCYHASIKSICLTSSIYPSNEIDLNKLCIDFSDKLIYHMYAMINHYVDDKFINSGHTIDIISGPQKGLTVGASTSQITIIYDTNFASNELIKSTLEMIQRNVDPRTENIFLSQAWKDLHEGNYRASVIHAALACEFFILIFLEKYFTTSCTDSFSKYILQDLRPTLGTLSMYLSTITSLELSKYKYITISRNMAAHQNYSIDYERACKTVRLANEFIYLELSNCIQQNNKQK